MDIRDPRGLKRHAAEALNHASYPPHKLVLLHTGVSVGLSVLLAVVDFFLAQQIANTGGLSGMGIRSILSTVQSLLRLAVTVGLTFWEFGILYAALRLSRREAAGPDSLSEGFRRFGPLLRLQLLRGVILFGLMMASFYIGTLVFFSTPLVDPVYEILEPFAADAGLLGSGVNLDEATLNALIPHMWPIFLIAGVLLCAVGLPLFYRYRMAEYAILDGDKVGAFASIRMSSQLMRGNRAALFRLDLSFWWYYLLLALTQAVAFGDTLLQAFGVTLPISPDVALLLCNCICFLCQLALYYRFRAPVETTYAAAFDALQQGMVMPAPTPTPQKQNWNYEES